MNRLTKLLNESLVWNITKLPNNTLALQLKKYFEEVDEFCESLEVEELGDVLITIGGMMRFDSKLAYGLLQNFFNDVDTPHLYAAIIAAENKIPVLYQRDYSDGYHHK